MVPLFTFFYSHLTLCLSLSQSLSPLSLNVSDPRLCRPQGHRPKLTQAPSCRSTPPTHAFAWSSISTLTQRRQAWVSLDFVGFIIDPSFRFLWVSLLNSPLPSSAHCFGFPLIQALVFFFFFFFVWIWLTWCGCGLIGPFL